MPNSFYIQRIAILGAGVMGAQIAALCADAGFETAVYDLAAKEGHKNAMVDKAIAHLKQLKPSPLGTESTLQRLSPKNYDEQLSELAHYDLIIEAIGERMDWKVALYHNIAPYLHKNAILVTNTSGLSIHALAEALPAPLRLRFCGVHFFNPPRYMHLAELIPSKTTPQPLLNDLETWLTRYLGKGVIRAKDTPNFIANRVGVFSLLSTMHHAEQFQLGLDEVDALTGMWLGRPKSATFRTMDVVGLDTMQHVVDTMKEKLPDDPWHALYHLPSWLLQMIAEGHLGQKSGEGIYRKSKQGIDVYDVTLGKYRLSNAEVHPEVKAILSLKNPQERMEKLFESQEKQARFLSACWLSLFYYCAYHLKDIAHSVLDVDLAMKWGFGWQQGPFETWQAAGVSSVYKVMQAAGASGTLNAPAALPEWLMGIDAFYTEQGGYVPETQCYEPASELPVYARQEHPEHAIYQHKPSAAPVYENEGVCLRVVDGDIGVLSFKSKANTIGQAVVDGIAQALEYSIHACSGLIFYQDDPLNFSSGADLRSVGQWLKEGKIHHLDALLKQFQHTVLALKYAPIPTVAALRGRALGGGCELMMHCQATVAVFESYPGLVELGVGLIPAGGGCKEMAYRAATQSGDADVMHVLSRYYQQIAKAQVALSARDAQHKGYLQKSDIVMMHANEILLAAVNQVRHMQATNALPPVPQRFSVAGREGHARLKVGLVNWLEGGFISEHDVVIADQLAFVLCGGNVPGGTLVDEAWMLALEREAFLTLASTEKTQQRIQHLLETGKPLRN